MFYKRFTFLIIIRIALLVGNVLVIAYIFGDRRLFFNQIILFLILAIQVAELIRFVNHTNRDLSRLFLAIRHSDFSVTFKQASLGKSFKALQESMKEIIEAYKKVKIEKEAQFHFLQMLVEQLHIGIISIEDQDVVLINRTAEQLLGIEGLKSWKFIKQFNPSFIGEVEQLGDQGRKLMEVKNVGGTKMISVDVRTPVILDKPLKLITFQDINSEIEQKEIEAWHKLIRILTHEIMNSVTPISSLTETMQGILQEKHGEQKSLSKITEENIADIRFSLNTIHKRSEGLLTFVDNYRRITRIPRPELQVVNVKEFLTSIVHLMQPELKQKKIQLTLATNEENLTVQLDQKLVEQVIINLITNSIHALGNSENPTIKILAYEQDKSIIIEVADNGKGIPEKELTEIFIPFFSTKKEGSGIGLSLSKQIMSLHGGRIRAISVYGAGATFYLHFRK